MQGHATWRSRVRLSELSPSGTVRPDRVLEWMQEAAAYASTLVGYPPDRYAEMGAAWFIREILLVMEAEARYGQVVEVDTWISDLRRFRARREYRVRVDGVQMARGQAEWLFLERDVHSGKIKPRLPDDALKLAFPVAEASAIAATDIPEYLELQGPPLDIDRRRAAATEIDRNGHVNHTRYLAWLEDHATEIVPGSRLRFARIEYLDDVQPGTDVELLVWPAEGGLVHQVRRGAQRALRARTLRG